MESRALALARAVGVLPKDVHLRRALRIDADEEFFTVPPVGLKLPPQDYQSFCTSSPFADGLPGGVKIVPFGLPRELSGLQSLATTLSCYLGGLDVVVQPIRGVDSQSMRLFRRASDRLIATDLLDTLTRQMPAAGSIVLGITTEPIVGVDGCSPTLVAGFREQHTAVISLPALEASGATMSAHPGTGLVLTVIRACLHLLGMDSCGFASCLMNPWDGTAQPPPLPLCPVCLRKLSLVVGVGAALRVGSSTGGQGFDVVRRYMNLAERCREVEIEQYVRWYEERVMAITQKPWAVTGKGPAVESRLESNAHSSGGSAAGGTAESFCADARGSGAVSGPYDAVAQTTLVTEMQAAKGGRAGLFQEPACEHGACAKTAQLRLLKSRRRGSGRGSESGQSRHEGAAAGDVTSSR